MKKHQADRTQKVIKKKRKKKEKLPITPRSRFVSALRLLWLRSRERAFALKRDKNICQTCKRKGFKITSHGAVVDELKLEVHHLDGIDWNGLVDLIRARMFQTPDRLQTICKDCHDKEHGREKKIAAGYPEDDCFK